MDAEDSPHRAVQFDDAVAPRAQVQAIDVLRHDAIDNSGALQVREGEMPCIRLGGGERAPSQVAADPVAAAGLFACEELLRGHRRTHGSAFATVVGDA